MEIVKYELSTLNGCVVDLESKIGDLEHIRSDAQANTALDVKSVKPTNLPEIAIYEHIDYGGRSARTNLNWYYVGDFWNDRISSFVVASGIWRLYEHWHYEGRYWDFGPGYYRWVEQWNVPNDTISSFKVIGRT